MAQDNIKERIIKAYQSIKLWSANNQEAIKTLKPDLGLRDWDSLDKEEKDKIWKHLKHLFEHTKPDIDNRIRYSIHMLNTNNKYKSFAPKYLTNPTIDNASSDFYEIFHRESQHVILEMLSYYLKYVLYEKDKHSYEIYKKNREPKEEFEKRFTKWLYSMMDNVIEHINDTFEQFSLNICCSRQGFIPKQDEKITEEIYKPTLKALSDPKWEKVNSELTDAFSDYLKKTPDSYSSCITHAVASVEAFLQILNEKEIGKGKLNDLIKKSFSEGLIPNDIFTKTIFKNIESILVRERQETGDAHPKIKYSNEKNARLALNLTMIFIQHCLL